MTGTIDTEGTQCEDARLLIPWYVNGTLDRDDAALIERHRQTCAACEEEILAQTRLARSVATSVEGEDEEGAAGRSWERLAARVAAEQAASPRAERTPRIAPVRDTATWLRRVLLGLTVPALGAAAIAIAVVAVTPPSDIGPTPFQTLTGPGAEVAGPRLRVRAGPDMTAEALTRIVGPLGAAVEDGPSTTGVFTLTPVEGADPDAIATALRKQPGIDFVTVRNGE